MNEKGKGKAPSQSKGKGFAITPSVKQEEVSAKLHPTCGICIEPFHATYSPAAAVQSANSSGRMQFGTHLPCPQSHGYCISCLNSYINSKLDPDGSGASNPNSVVFPIRCPECPVNDWPQGIPNEVAERVLTEKGMTLWVSAFPRLYFVDGVVLNPWSSFLAYPEAPRQSSEILLS